MQNYNDEITEKFKCDRSIHHPAELNTYLPRYRTFVFFQPTNNAAPHGYLGVPVTAERSIATDKSLTPPGALALIHTQIPFRSTRTARTAYC
nr:hypothetical protein [Chroococcidiopsis sp. [FACHB-1243]]